jgi:mevalonate kinase
LGSAERFLELIQQNQRCLEKIGVVSESTRRFIKEIEANGGVAKVAGAGGFEQGSGVVLVFGLDRELVESIAQNFGFLGYPSVNLAGPGLVALD